MVEVESEILDEVIGCKDYHKRAERFGERAWIAEGQEVYVVYWDCGNSWCDIMEVVPKKREADVMKTAENFYRKLRKAIAQHYDENMLRVD